jgi:hypothetical protein
MRDIICTRKELTHFAFSEYTPTAFNFARFIESKSGKKYTVIEREFIFDALETLKKHTEFSENLSKEFKTKWKGIIDEL